MKSLTIYLHEEDYQKVKQITEERRMGLSQFYRELSCIHSHLIPRKAKTGVCLECLKNNQRKYYAKIRKSRQNLTDPEKILKRKAYYQANRKKLLQNGKEYRKTNKKKIKIQRQQHYQENKERIDRENKAWRKSNKDRMDKYYKTYYNDNLKDIRARKRKYYEDNQEKLIQYQRDFRKSVKEEKNMIDDRDFL